MVLRIIKKIFDLFRYVISIIVLIGLFGCSYMVLSKTFQNEEIDEELSFHNLPENTMEAIVLGSSHAQYSFSPAFFYQETGLYSYVLGTPCQPLDASSLMLKEALKTQSPKIVFLEVFTAMPLKRNCDGISCYITAGFEMRGQERYEALKKLPEDKYETYVNPFISSHNDWRTTEITIEDAAEQIKNTIMSFGKQEEKDISQISSLFGYHENYPVYPVENSWYASILKDHINVELKEEDVNALNSIYELCQNNNIELILFKTPIDSLDDENLSYLNEVWKWADETGIKYVDFINESPKIDFQMCVQSDSYHSYINGASLITSRLANMINERQIEHISNVELEKMYFDASNGLTVTYLEYEYDPNKYFDRLLSFKGPMLIIYNGKKCKSEKINKFLDKYDISSQNIVLVDGEKIIDRSDSCVGIEYNNTNIYSDFSLMEIEGNVYENDCDLKVVVFCSDMKKYYQLNTNLKTMWKNGYHTYGE